METAEKLGLAKSKRWLALITDTQAQTQNENGVSASVGHFYALVHGLSQNKVAKCEMVDHVLSLAKYNNKFNVVDKLMKNFCRCIIEMKQNEQSLNLKKNLEVLLNTEVAIQDEKAIVNEAMMNHPLSHMLLAQAEFPFMSAGGKLQKIDQYKKDLS